MSLYDLKIQTPKGEEKSVNDYKAKAMIIVNTASKCGFAPQFDGLQELYEKYKEDGLQILGFPSNQFMNQEPGSSEEAEEHCRINYGVSFPMFAKTEVRGKDAHPLFKHLTKEAPGIISGSIKWNFTKFLIDEDGNVVKRYAPKTEPKDIEEDIKKLLAK
ncbi:glutathione peroxidase family protein [Gracilibacillus boraciitolerans JCM 21714]|uniref:Glutathione peroxidase n=1 Tax=Gracilibacillus boraciitolerans JCM 21714 TaxID=1298598 RepID=W4VL72_9BACI|nr:glutathione peroxidase [Gracilibacillus boraciitolerans]GAE93514.1 glutathione peroxidase family protein [Gracilibacillus boraciitolerans JCM 21714]